MPVPIFWGFDQITARTLKRLARQTPPSLLLPKEELPASCRAHVIIPDAEVAAATYSGVTSKWTLGTGTGKLYERDQSGDEGWNPDLDNTAGEDELIKSEDTGGSDISRRIRNLSETAIPADKPVLTVQDIHGDYYPISPGGAGFGYQLMHAVDDIHGFRKNGGSVLKLSAGTFRPIGATINGAGVADSPNTFPTVAPLQEIEAYNVARHKMVNNYPAWVWKDYLGNYLAYPAYQRPVQWHVESFVAATDSNPYVSWAASDEGGGASAFSTGSWGDLATISSGDFTFNYTFEADVKVTVKNHSTLTSTATLYLPGIQMQNGGVWRFTLDNATPAATINQQHIQMRCTEAAAFGGVAHSGGNGNFSVWVLIRPLSNINYCIGPGP